MYSKAIIEQATRLANQGSKGIRYARALLAAFPQIGAVIEINRTTGGR